MRVIESPFTHHVDSYGLCRRASRDSCLSFNLRSASARPFRSSLMVQINQYVAKLTKITPPRLLDGSIAMPPQSHASPKRTKASLVALTSRR